MKATVQVSFYNDDVKSKLQELNQLLNPYGIKFTSDQKELKTGKIQKQWHIDVDEDLLQQYTRSDEKKVGRPSIKIDYDKIVELRRQDKTNIEICKELGISKALFYLKVCTLENLEVGTRVEYMPIDEDTWYKATVQIDSYGRKYLQCDDGTVDYPRKRDVIRKI